MQIADAPQHVAARRRRRAAPEREAALRRRDRALDVRGVGERKAADQVVRVGRIPFSKYSPDDGADQAPAMKF